MVSGGVMKSCLNCVSPGFFIEASTGLYSYEGECNHYERRFDPSDPIHHIRSDDSDDQEELRELVTPIFENTANNCEYYKQTGVVNSE